MAPGRPGPGPPGPHRPSSRPAGAHHPTPAGPAPGLQLLRGCPSAPGLRSAPEPRPPGQARHAQRRSVREGGPSSTASASRGVPAASACPCFAFRRTADRRIPRNARPTCGDTRYIVREHAEFPDRSPGQQDRSPGIDRSRPSPCPGLRGQQVLQTGQVDLAVFTVAADVDGDVLGALGEADRAVQAARGPDRVARHGGDHVAAADAAAGCRAARGHGGDGDPRGRLAAARAAGGRAARDPQSRRPGRSQAGG
jgi:hypothetical protein